jgi:hypothetical protein
MEAARWSRRCGVVWRSYGHGVVAGGAVASTHGRGGVRCNSSGPVVHFGDDRGRKRRKEMENPTREQLLLSQACKHDAVEFYTCLGKTHGGRTLVSVGHSSTEETESMSKVVTDSRSLSLHIS